MKKKSILAGGLALCTLCTLYTFAPTEPIEANVAPTAVQTAASKKNPAAPSAAQVYKKITAGLEFPAQTDPNADMFRDLYKINRAYLKSYQIKMPLMSAHSNEIAVFQLKNKKYMNKVLPKVQKRLKDIQTNAFYPEQIKTAKQGKVVTKGNYILLVVDDNKEKIIKSFNQTVK